MSIKRKHRSDLSGVLGNQVTLDKVNGRVVAKNRPERKMGELTGKQAAYRERFLSAAQYAQSALADAETKAMYEAKVTDGVRSAFNVAVRDYIRKPKVHFIKTDDYIGQVGDTVRINATDDFRVTRVKVVIRGSDGMVLEKGEAAPEKVINHWLYTAKVANPSVEGTTIQVTAFDHPGNETDLEVTL